MAKICTKCGKENRDNMTYCADCGEKLPAPAPKVEEFESEPTMRAMPTQGQKPGSSAPAPAPVKAEPKKAEKKEKTEKKSEDAPSIFQYLLYMIIFALPIVGFIVAILMSFTATGKALQNFARAWVICAIIGAIILCIAWMVIKSTVEQYIATAPELAKNFVDEAVDGAVEGAVDEAIDLGTVSMREKMGYLFEMMADMMANGASITID